MHISYIHLFHFCGAPKDKLMTTLVKTVVVFISLFIKLFCHHLTDTATLGGLQYNKKVKKVIQNN